MNPTKVDCAEIHVLEKNLFHTVYCDNCILNAHHLEKIREAYTHLYGSEDLSGLKLIVEFQGNIDISQDIGERYLNNRIRDKIGEALVSENPRTQQFLQGASVVMNGSHPVKVFSSIKEAREWLESL